MASARALRHGHSPGLSGDPLHSVDLQRHPVGEGERPPAKDFHCGRGLTVVAALADRWGWERTGHSRKVVWAELALLGTVA
jgi:hypothetical protein